MHWIWSVISTLTAQSLRVKKGSSDRALYLTFDDGPHPENTPILLDVLAKHGAKATFFLLGTNAAKHPEIVQRIVQEGHVIANHSMTHANFRKLSPSQQLKEIHDADLVLQPHDGMKKHAFRPPRGNATVTTILLAIFFRQPLVLWSFDSFDFKLPVSDLTQRLKGFQPRNGDILLFHDDMPSTWTALDQTLNIWRTAGFEFPPL